MKVSHLSGLTLASLLFAAMAAEADTAGWQSSYINAQGIQEPLYLNYPLQIRKSVRGAPAPMHPTIDAPLTAGVFVMPGVFEPRYLNYRRHPGETTPVGHAYGGDHIVH
ncbi:MAG: hypothetical protein HWE39_09105 [Oceanospirillaceae bacterium]|nr:hypothetical protein [Oceanospirillaceae bacterium]